MQPPWIRMGHGCACRYYANPPKLSLFVRARTGVNRVVKCCQACGVENLIFTSSCWVTSSEAVDDDSQAKYTTDATRGGGRQNDHKKLTSVPWVTLRGNARAQVVAKAETVVLRARRVHSCCRRLDPRVPVGADTDPPADDEVSRPRCLAWWAICLSCLHRKKRSDTSSAAQLSILQHGVRHVLE